MDPFTCIAEAFKTDCIERLRLLEEVHLVFENSETTVGALLILFSHPSVNTEDIAAINAIPVNIERLKNCIDGIEEIIKHARKMFAVSFNKSNVDRFLIFNQEICFSYTCKMLFSVGPRICHFSNAPTRAEIVNAELNLALHSPYSFTRVDELLCYESMPKKQDD